MANRMTVDDILPLVANLTPQERARLWQPMSSRPSADAASGYGALPPGEEEFLTDDEPLAWEAEGWEQFD